LTDLHPGLDLATSMIPQIPTVEFPDHTGAVLDKSREVMQQVTEKAATRASEAASRLTMPVSPLEPEARREIRDVLDKPREAAQQVTEKAATRASEAASRLTTPVSPLEPEARREIRDVLDKPREAAQQVTEKAVTRVSKAASHLTTPVTPVTPLSDLDLRLPVDPLDQAALQEIRAALEEAAREFQNVLGRERESVMETLHSGDEDARQMASDFLLGHRRYVKRELAPHLDRIRRRYNSIARRLEPETRKAIEDRLQLLRDQLSGSQAELEHQIKYFGSTYDQSVEGVKKSCMGLVGVLLSLLLPGLGHFLIGSAGPGGVLLFIGIFLRVAFPEAIVLNCSLSFLAAWHVWMLTRN
jgi:hypothetical protein